MAKLFEGVRQNKKSVLKSIGLAVLFFAVQFAYQFYINGDATLSTIRSAAFTAATLIALALLTGPLSRIFPKINYVQRRRTLGVLGFTFGIVHVLAVITYVAFDLSLLFAITNPFVNPVIFGGIAFLIYIPIYITSTDWANAKLGFKKWKAIHRLVYFAWIATVLHFLLVNTPALFNASGYLLLTVTLLVFAFETTAFIKWPSRGKNTIIGIIVLLFGAAMFYLTKTAFTGSLVVNIIIYGFVLYVIGVIFLLVVSRKKKPEAKPEIMAQN
ncbi:MAG TPA: ferric reductase-like transmembrane domain-containing protein [archaeon]|nr:ferric reductase-like transmembrane domain-containing protein [archaeon]